MAATEAVRPAARDRGTREETGLGRMIRGLLALLSALAIAGCAAPRAQTATGQTRPVEVMVVATMHGAHQDSPRYSYDDLYALVGDFDPDVLGVEIRAEDLGRGDDYLAANYPLEMRELARRYPERVVGIDWLGEDLEGRPVPENYWRDRSEIKRLEHELAEDGELSSPAVDEAQARQGAILEGATAASLNDGRYDRASADYYAALARLLEGSRYARLSEFYAERDRRIAMNAVAAVAALRDSGRNGGRALFVVGADHRGPLVDTLEREFGDEILLAPVP